MKIIDFILDEDLLSEQQASLSDTIRMAFYQENKLLFGLLNYEDDFAFLEPTLFCYFLSEIGTDDKISLLQSILGYVTEQKRPQTVLVKADSFGLINIPNWGYLRAKPNETITVDNASLTDRIEINEYLENTRIRLNIHLTDLLRFESGVSFHESPEETLRKNKGALCTAVSMFRSQMPEYWKIIESITREVVVFSSPDYNSFAGIMQHGTAYFNVEKKLQSPIFFIEDIAHQCGHIIYNALTLDAEKYLKVTKEQPLAGFTEIIGETRGVYGAFHGLFTYVSILYSLDQILNMPLNQEYRYETIGRIGFYLPKFHHDIILMSNEEILSPDGMHFLKQFKVCFETMAKKYAEIARFNYENQPYMFQYDIFKKDNPM